MAFMMRRLVASDQTWGGVEETQLEREEKKYKSQRYRVRSSSCDGGNCAV